MQFSGVCLITRDVPRLRQFYTRVLCVGAEGDDRHLELRTEGVSVAIFSAGGMEEMAPLSTKGMGHGGVTIGFKVKDLDVEHRRLAGIGDIDFVKQPQTHPWGTRSFWFRDPDGNIVNFWCPASR